MQVLIILRVLFNGSVKVFNGTKESSPAFLTYNNQLQIMERDYTVTNNFYDLELVSATVTVVCGTTM